jgi:hypothetical protein
MISFILAIVAAAIFLLRGLGAIEDTEDVFWLGIGLFFLALAVAFTDAVVAKIRTRGP